MTEESLRCGHCGHVFSDSAGGSGRTARCPVCDEPIPRPDTGSGDEAPRLVLRSDRAVDGVTPLCPACKSLLRPEDRICGACGMPVGEDAGAEGASAGSRVRPFRRPRAARRVRPASRGPRPTGSGLGRLALGLLVGVGLGYLGARCREGGREARPPPAPEAPDGAAQEDPLPAARAAVRAMLDARMPLATEGATVDLELTTGRVLRGRVLRRDVVSLRLVTEEGVEAVPFDRLRPASRLRVDPDYREQHIEAEARRRAGEPAVR